MPQGVYRRSMWLWLWLWSVVVVVVVVIETVKLAKTRRHRGRRPTCRSD